MVPVGLGVVVCFLSSHRQIIPGRSVRVHRGPAWSLRFQRPATFDPRLSRSGATASCNNVDRRMSPCPVAGLRTEGSIELAGDTPAQRERCDRSSARRCRRPTAPPPTISGDALSLGNEHLAQTLSLSQGAGCKADARTSAQTRFEERGGIRRRPDRASVAPSVPRKAGPTGAMAADPLSRFAGLRISRRRRAMRALHS